MVEVGRGGTEHETAGRHRPSVGQCLTAIAHRPNRALRVREKSATGVGEPHAAPRAREEGLAQLLLQRVQAGGKGRLRQEHRLGRPADVAAPRNL